jgi:hypothetical protein
VQFMESRTFANWCLENSSNLEEVSFL